MKAIVAAGDIEGDKEELVSLRLKPASDEVKRQVEARGASIALRERAAREVHGVDHKAGATPAREEEVVLH